MRFSNLVFAFSASLLLLGCGLKTDPDNSDSAGDGGSGARDGGSDSGGSGAGGDSGSTGGRGGSGGSTGGSGGTGGAPECDADEECPASSPKCDEGECAPCTSNASCEEREAMPFCQVATGSSQVGECVACIEDDHCEGNDDGAYCNNNECVPCRTHADCTELSEPQCNDEGQCVGCTSSEACEGRDDAEVCRTDVGPTRGHCVACMNDSECDDPAAPQCQSDNTCGACTSNDACDGRDDTEHCNLREDADTFGECVQCTGATEADDCDGKSCEQSTGTCTGTDTDSLNPCEACSADSECQGNRKCLMHNFGGTDIGYFCFSARTTAGCASEDNSDAKPYSVVLEDARSVDGDDSLGATYCLPPTTCEALDDASAVVNPGDQGCAVDNECGVSGINDGQCVERGESATLKCTYSCDTDYECPSDLSRCLGTGDKFCSP